jgi:hypothetical protein
MTTPFNFIYDQFESSQPEEILDFGKLVADKAYSIATTKTFFLESKDFTQNEFRGVEISLDGKIITHFKAFMHGEDWQKSVEIDTEDFTKTHEELCDKYRKQRHEQDAAKFKASELAAQP